MKRLVSRVGLLIAAVLLTSAFQPLAQLPTLARHASAPQQQGNCQTFPQTGKTICDKFLSYWQQHGGLAQQGYPISDEMQEKSALNGQTYTVQYFERAVFEKHPENQPPYDVLLSQLGTFRLQGKYPTTAPNQHVSTTNPRVFQQTGHTVGGVFRTYWEAHGGLAQQGYPISDEFTEVSALNGQPYTVQYFERAVFELHPENAGTPYEVLLSQLGTFRYRDIYNNPVGTATPTEIAAPTATPAAKSNIVVDIQYGHGRIQIENQSSLIINSTNDAIIARLFERIYEATNQSGTVDAKYVVLPFGTDLSTPCTRKDDPCGYYQGLGVEYEYFGCSGCNPPTLDLTSYHTEIGPAGISYFQIDPKDLPNWQVALSGTHPHSATDPLDDQLIQSGVFLRLLVGIFPRQPPGYNWFADVNKTLGPELCPYVGCTKEGFSRVPLHLAWSK